MIQDDVVEAFNNRLTANLTNIKTMTPLQLDRVKTVGTAAENLLKNKDTLKKIESKFKETNGSLADKMISAFESIPDDISYGDKRCIENYNLSSNKAFLRTFHNEKLIINIEVFSDNNKTDATYLLSEKYHESKD